MSDWDQSQQGYDDSSTNEEPAVGGWGDTYGEQTYEQTYDGSSTYEEPAVGGWGDTYGDAPAQDQGQGFWEDVKDWVDDLIPDSSQPESSESGGGLSDLVDGLVDGILRPAQHQLDQHNQMVADHLAAFRGSLNTAIQATELLGAESSSDQVQYASGLITSAANTAYAAADEIGRETQTGGKYAYYSGALAQAAGELEAIAWSNSEAMRQTDIPDVLAKLMMVGRDSESLY